MVVAAVCILLVGALDGGIAALAGFDFTVTVFYVVPIGFAAWAAGAAAGFTCAAFAATVEAAVTWWSAHGAMGPWILAASIGLEFLVFLGAAFTFARLRWHLERHRQLSRLDPLTGIGNERTFDAAVKQEVARGARKPAPFSVVYLDVDRFKELNDSRGHSSGNQLLRLIGGTLQGTVRKVDTVARVGGDEFALLLPDTGPEVCRHVVDRLRERLGLALRGAGFANTFSVGAVTFEGPPVDADDLLIAADRAMYKIKHGPRDGVHYEVVPGALRVPEATAAGRPTSPDPSKSA